ncbi:accessory factor UbiK family protein [Thiolapillus sp.]
MISMIDPKILNDISSKVGGTLPKGLQALQNDLEHNLHSGVEAMLGKLNLVTREEFDVQQAVLMRTRAKVEALEKQVSELEKILKDK